MGLECEHEIFTIIINSPIRSGYMKQLNVQVSKSLLPNTFLKLPGPRLTLPHHMAVAFFVILVSSLNILGNEDRIQCLEER